jgi:hypothetical protein
VRCLDPDADAARTRTGCARGRVPQRRRRDARAARPHRRPCVACVRSPSGRCSPRSGRAAHPPSVRSRGSTGTRCTLDADASGPAGARHDRESISLGCRRPAVGDDDQIGRAVGLGHAVAGDALLAAGADAVPRPMSAMSCDGPVLLVRAAGGEDRDAEALRALGTRRDRGPLPRGRAVHRPMMREARAARVLDALRTDADVLLLTSRAAVRALDALVGREALLEPRSPRGRAWAAGCGGRPVDGGSAARARADRRARAGGRHVARAARRSAERAGRMEGRAGAPSCRAGRRR